MLEYAKVKSLGIVMRRLQHAGSWGEVSALEWHHRRSLIETKMNCIKRLGKRVMSRVFERQVNELHIRAAILNRFTELGRPQTAALA